MALGGAHTTEEVADVIITEGLAGLGGNAGAIGLLTPDRTGFHTVRCHGYPPEMVAAFTYYSYETSLPTADAARTGEPIFLETLAERNRVYPHLSGGRIRGGRGATVALPLIARGEVLGGLTLNFPTDRSFSLDDRAFMQTIAEICAQALDRAQTYDAAQQEIVQRKAAESELARLLAREHQVAATLQRSLLRMPPADSFAGLSFATRYESASSDLEVGGDFLDAFVVATHRIALVVGDVSGKGLAAAASTSEVKYTLRAFVRQFGDPAAALAHLNDYLIAWHSLDTLQGPESFFALALAVVDTEANTAIFAGAGMENPLIVRASGEAWAVPCGGLPLGVLPESEYEPVAAPFCEGDLLAIATDGITEARPREPAHPALGDLGIFGYEAFVRAAISARDCEPGVIAERILDDARRFAGGTLRDDTAVLVARRTCP